MPARNGSRRPCKETCGMCRQAVAMSKEQFRQFCQALMCSQLGAQEKVRALRPASWH